MNNPKYLKNKEYMKLHYAGGVEVSSIDEPNREERLGDNLTTKNSNYSTDLDK